MDGIKVEFIQEDVNAAAGSPRFHVPPLGIGWCARQHQGLWDTMGNIWKGCAPSDAIERLLKEFTASRIIHGDPAVALWEQYYTRKKALHVISVQTILYSHYLCVLWGKGNP